ncbi:M15 family metallopeptidase [Lactiplantibacillus modestisalitolerans]|uniref:D-alanyl-D-alanine carboxypeptidase family protein n=1 Tax=Lactiplantibacillus modestisalitolerans TaxID=1457219 RepID=A0ABV5WW50_9LACO|nr:M15 family metallopeptidase [Lactiplantibacillus modestisalitolerans]
MVLRKRSLYLGVLVSLSLLVAGCSGQQATAKTATARQSSVAKKTTNRQRLIRQLPKGVKSTDADLIVVNKWHRHGELSFKKVQVDGITVRQSIQKPLTAFINGAEKAGYQTSAVSGYRSVADQKRVWNQSIATYKEQGKSAKQALKLTREYVAVPGGSEHQTGLAADIINTKWFTSHGNQLLSASDQSKGQRWLINHAAQYGFVLRFPKNGVRSTGIDYESWHFRYVGRASAEFMTKHHLTLEQYVSLLKARES